MTQRRPSRDKKKIKIDILTKLWRRRKFGGSYTPIEQAMSGISRNEWDKGRKVIEEMIREGLIELHKKNCISINLSAKGKVRELLEGHLPEYYL